MRGLIHVSGTDGRSIKGSARGVKKFDGWSIIRQVNSGSFLGREVAHGKTIRSV